MVFGSGIPLLNHLMGWPWLRTLPFAQSFGVSSQIFFSLNLWMCCIVRTIVMVFSSSCNMAQDELPLNMKLTSLKLTAKAPENQRLEDGSISWNGWPVTKKRSCPPLHFQKKKQIQWFGWHLALAWPLPLPRLIPAFQQVKTKTHVHTFYESRISKKKHGLFWNMICFCLRNPFFTFETSIDFRSYLPSLWCNRFPTNLLF